MRIALLHFLLWSVAALAGPKHGYFPATASRSCGAQVDTHARFAQKITEIHTYKGTFEYLFPAENNSIASRFPEFYKRVFRLFWDRPSYLQGMNRGIPPTPGMTISRIFSNISEFAYYIGEDLRVDLDAYQIPEKDPARRIVLKYVDRFKRQKPVEERSEVYDPTDSKQAERINNYGQPKICGLWAELRLSMLIGHLSEIHVHARDLVRSGVIDNSRGILNSVDLSQEIDHYWFPNYKVKLTERVEDHDGLWRPGLDYTPDAVAIGDTKVFDTVFTMQSSGRRDTYEQLERYLKIASLMGAQRGLEAQVYYFFVAGIDKEMSQKLHDIAAEFNANLKRRGVSTEIQAPVKLILYGQYK